MSGEEAGLNLRQETDRDFLLNKRVGDFLGFAFLPGGEDGFSRIIFEKNGPRFFDFEIFGGDLFAVDEGETKSVSKVGAEFFHEVKGEGLTAGAEAVEEAHLGIKTDGFAGGTAVVGEHDVEEGEERVDGVKRRTTGAVCEDEGAAFLLRESNQFVKDGEVGDGGFAFDAAEGVERVGVEGGFDAM